MTATITLREVKKSDLPVFFEHQLDDDANRMAAFTHKDPSDRDAFYAHWAKILSDENIVLRTIVYSGQVAGNIVCHGWFGKPELSYWIGKGFWGKGIASRALMEFLGQVKERPLHARVAKDNIASIRVLAKNGFHVCGEDKGFSNARGEEVEEFIMKLEAGGTK